MTSNKPKASTVPAFHVYERAKPLPRQRLFLKLTEHESLSEVVATSRICTL